MTLLLTGDSGQLGAKLRALLHGPVWWDAELLLRTPVAVLFRTGT